MMNVLTGLGYGIIGLAIMIGIGMVVLITLGNIVGGSANTTIQSIVGYLGTGSGGLASFIPLVIIIVIGLLFLGMFMGKKGKQY
jgi:hypothetical protein